MRLRIATFNIENLAARDAFGKSARPETKAALSLFDFSEPRDRENAERAIALMVEDEKRQATALAIAEARADVLICQEVDNLGVLQPFLANYVHEFTDLRYGHLKVIDGNDPRGIDVAFAARRDLVAGKNDVRFKSHHERTFGELGVLDESLAEFGIGPDDLVFNRDCLEATLDLGEAELTIFACHFKSMGQPDKGGRDATRPIREAEAKAVRAIVQERFGDEWREANWIVAGDLNDFRERILAGGRAERSLPSGIDVLFDDFGVNPVERLLPAERWTLFHQAMLKDGSLVEEHVQLDYLLLSPALAAANPEPAVEIVRRGLPYRVPLDPAHPDRSVAYLATRADRYPRVGWDRPKASDHCPLVVEIDVPPRRL
ncbi:endonuclease/exonuclease/phosphatase family protein [Salinarimonas soli]|uniref:Endonuclease n=1 Tax=Salinarimonas soli TaxID=1638099 RepID=A0A5B2V8P6_9HYPH|nr:endonuclease/exonuclease/phosphatase family protein [Salinarimonas soli]KAA2235176.1 endonuclease [Salinarimonas soli]